MPGRCLSHLEERGARQLRYAKTDEPGTSARVVAERHGGGGVDGGRNLRGERYSDFSGNRRTVERVQAGRLGHAGSFRARSAPGLGMVQLAAGSFKVLAPAAGLLMVAGENAAVT